MKKIGVIGGIGPQATMDFEVRLHAESQRLLPQRANSGYPPLIVYYLREPPIRLKNDNSLLVPMQPSPALLEAAARIGPLCDFLVLIANGPHSFEHEIAEAAGKPLLSMVNLAIESVRQRGWKRCGVVGMGEPTVYTDRLADVGVECETLPVATIERLDRAIIAVMEGQANENSARETRDALEQLFHRGVEGIVLGCTELPLLLGEAADAPTFVNPAQLLAAATLRQAIDN